MFEYAYIPAEEMKDESHGVNCHIRLNISHAIRMDSLHCHPNTEIELVHNGRCLFENNRWRMETQAACLVIHLPFSLHRVNSDEHAVYRRDICRLSPTFTAKLMLAADDAALLESASLIYTPLSDAELDELAEYMRRLSRLCTDPDAQVLMASLMLRRAIRMASARGVITATPYTYIQDALKYISAHLSDSMTIGKLAAHYSVGRSKFQSDFRAAIGMPYGQYLKALRLTRAREMLLSGESIIRTALECGYSAEAHFIAAFREFWGITPGALLRTDAEAPR